MSIGKRIRLSSWLKQGRSFLVALDEVIPRGLDTARVDPVQTLGWLSKSGVDGLVLHAGLAVWCTEVLVGGPPWIMKLTTNSHDLPDRTVRGPVGSVEYALALGASGVAINVFVGSAYERDHFSFLTSAVETGERFGMPVIAFINPPGERQFEPQGLAYACRIGFELGADVVKTDYSGNAASFRQVIASCPLPVLVEDTPLPETPEGTLETVRGALEAGAAGALLGSRGWGTADGRALVQKISSLIHPNPGEIEGEYGRDSKS